MSNKPPAKKAAARRTATMPAAPPPPPPPPVETTAAAEQEQAPAPAPAAGGDAVGQRLRELDIIGPQGSQQDPQEPPQPQPEPQQAPAAPEPQASAGGALAPFLGNSLARNLGTENPREFPRDSPREFPRAQEVPPAAPAQGGFARRAARTREDNVLGKKRHPRQETGQLNPGVRLFLAESVKVYADEEHIGKGAAVDHLLELGLRLEAPDLVARRYAARAAALGSMNDWADASEALLEMAMRHTDEATVLRVLARLKAEAQGHQ